MSGIREAEGAEPQATALPGPPLWQDASQDPLVAVLQPEFGEMIESARSFAGDLVLEVQAAALVRLAGALKDLYHYTCLVDVCGIDVPERERRFEVVYVLYSFRDNRRLRLKVKVGREIAVPSVTAVWQGAAWPEREVHDMYGVPFSGHPDLARILLWEGFDGFPLRKDFPLEGIDTGAARDRVETASANRTDARMTGQAKAADGAAAPADSGNGPDDRVD
ncbi:MAG: NADH-quinone oxidoreductase subunit C [Acidobacteriota bacterium]|nr:NADH-quinone oxidoreductase subunit C [Acidobacteriota bacterium]